MCGIFGYTGNENAVRKVMKGLHYLEYRGYDSAGIAMQKANGIQLVKSPGRVKILDTKVKDYETTNAIGHTRWATHGLPTEANAHPHQVGKFAIVHNGIIENFMQIKEKLIEEGAIFKSETDSEVIAHLFNKYYEGDLLETAKKVSEYLEGAYALGIVCEDFPDIILTTCQDSPLIVGTSKTGGYISSDMNALQGMADDVVVLSDREFAILDNNVMKFYDKDGKDISKKYIDISGLKENVKDNNFVTHMMSEMHEIPLALDRTIEYYEENGLPVRLNEDLSIFNRAIIIACGTAKNAGMAGKIMIEKLIGIPTTVEYASEFRYSNPILEKNTLIIAVSQSGETADTIAAVRLARSKNLKVLSIVNVKDSTLTRNSDYVMHTFAGAEIAVAATKSYNCQVCVFAILTALWCNNKQLLKEIKKLPKLAENCLQATIDCDLPFKTLTLSEKVFFIGRQMDYATALEGSLKLKEISYIMSEGYPAGELKHGTLALIDDGCPIISIITSRDISSKTLNAIHEVKARGAKVLLLTPFNDIIKDAECETFILPEINELLIPIISIIPLQYISHEVSIMRGCNPDRPRNLAKSVTVE